MKSFKKFWSLIILLLFCGCVKDEPRVSGTGKPGDQVSVTLSITVPGKSIPQTRELSVQDERQVNELDVLVFLESGSSYTYAYHTSGVLSGNSTPTDILYTLDLRNSNSGEKYLLVFIANLSDRVNAVVSSLPGLSKEAALAKITFDAQNYCDQSGTVIRYLPMWGEFGSLEITPSLAGTTLGTVHMLRSVASVDVVVNMNSGLVPQGLGDKFYIKAVSLVNGQAVGQAAPYADRFNPTGGISGNGIVTAPSLPATAAIGEPVTSEHSSPGISFIRDLYVPEAVNSATNPISVVVEGIYIEEGGLPSDGESSFYRIELIHNNDKTTAHDLLRNHRYIINIQNVYGPGYQTFDIAMQEPPLNIITQLLVTQEDFDISYITFNESYFLGVNFMELEVEGNSSHDLSIKILTNHHDGWTAKMSSSQTDPDAGVDGDWLYFTSGDPLSITAQGAAGAVYDCNFTVPAMTSGAFRNGYIHITAGHLKLVVHIFQVLGGS